MQLCTMFGGGTYEHLQTIYIFKIFATNIINNFQKSPLFKTLLCITVNVTTEELYPGDRGSGGPTSRGLGGAAEG